MGFESPQNFEETPEQRADKYYQEALEVAQRISQRWQKIREDKKSNPNLSLGAKLEEIDSMTRPPVPGIRAWFESQIDLINRQGEGDPNTKSRMMFRLKEDLEHVEQQLDDKGY